MRDVHVVLFWNAEMASLSVAPGSSVHAWRSAVCTRGDSPGCCLQLRSSHYLPRCMQVPWKLPTKT
jgi:hypothetical protein